jgi:hypothetical protein
MTFKKWTFLGMTYDESDTKNLINTLICGLAALVGFEFLQYAKKAFKTGLDKHKSKLSIKKKY